MSNEPSADSDAGKRPHIGPTETPDGPRPHLPEPVTVPASFVEAVSVVSAHRGALDRFERNPEQGPKATWRRGEEDGSRPGVRVLVNRSLAEGEFVEIEIECREAPTFFALYRHAILRGFACEIVATDDFDSIAGCGE